MVSNKASSPIISSRSLQFQETATVFFVESIDDMSDEEIDAYYYSPQDYVGFRDREKNMSRHFSTWESVRQSRIEDFIGVESNQMRKNRRRRCKNAIFAVILEQELRQAKEHHHNVENVPPESTTTNMDNEDDDNALIIARVYQQYTTESTRLAVERGELNAAIVSALRPLSLSSSRYYDGDDQVSVAPWQLPARKQQNNKANNNNHPLYVIKYSTCTHPIFPHHYYAAGMSSSFNEPAEQKFNIQYNFRYGRPRHGWKERRQQAPVQQRMIRNHHEYCCHPERMNYCTSHSYSTYPAPMAVLL